MEVLPTTVYVIKDLKNNYWDYQQSTPDESIARESPTKFPKLFQGLGTLKRDYQIQLKPDAKPYALYTARNVPIPLQEKIKQELQRMRKFGVISKVDKPTFGVLEWWWFPRSLVMSEFVLT